MMMNHKEQSPSMLSSWIIWCMGPCLALVTFFGAPLLLAGLSQDALKVLACALWMVFWWVTDRVPLHVTALIPALVFPLLGILDSKLILRAYTSNVVFLFLGGFVLSIAIEKHNLHKQMAFYILRCVGQQKKYIVLGFMAACAFISLWISNTASAMIMLPVAVSITANSTDHKFNRALLFGIAYAASIGGIGTLIGTPANAILIGFMEKASMNSINFLSWMVFALPLVAIGLLTTWLFLVQIYFRVEGETSAAAGSSIEGVSPSVTEPLAQQKVWLIFAFTVVMWLVGPFLNIAFINDVSVALLGASLLFLFGVLNFSDLSKIQWKILILFGGGLALSEAIQVSGLGLWFGELFRNLDSVHPLVLTFGIVSVIILITELLSNTACASIFIPLAAGLSDRLNLEITTLLMVVTLGSSLSFMLPMATPPNAILFSLSGFKVKEMIRVGFFINFIFALLISLAALYWLPVVLIR